MNKIFFKTFSLLANTFWLIPGLMVLAGGLCAIGLIAVDRSGAVPQWLIDSSWLYTAGAPARARCWAPWRLP